MARKLRPRKSQVNYANGHDGDESQAGPSASIATLHREDDVDSESDFTPEATAVEGNTDNNAEGNGDLSNEDGAEDELEVPSAKKGKKTASARQKPSRATSQSSVSRGAKRQQYVLPTPSVHHRHRAMPLHMRTGRVERLAVRPRLFQKPNIIMTNNFTHDAKVTDRVNKAWGYNVGNGPLWELAEDRGWFKEEKYHASAPGSDSYRRPRVYENVFVKDGWEVIDRDAASVYLPSDAEGETVNEPPPVNCFLGPFDDQSEVQLEMFATEKIADYIPESTSHILNAGAPVWGLDWCPIHADSRESHSYKQYLAVAPYPSQTHSPEIGVRVMHPAHACIQIWSLGPSEVSAADEEDVGKLTCELVLCIDAGPAHELKWCPLPSHDEDGIKNRPRKLGLLGGSFEDGSWSVYVVPDPRDVRPPGHDDSQPVFVKLPEPLLRIQLEETNCWAFDWGNSEVVAIGTTNGIIAVYDIGQHLKPITGSDGPTITELFPTHYITVHQSAIRALAWIKAPPALPSGDPDLEGDPTVIASGGYDGVECMTDIREGHGSVMNRTRDVINTMAFSPFGGGPVTIDHENIVKAYSASPSMLGRGHTLLEPQGPVWSVNASDLHPQLAVGAADGSCITTNTLRSTRRGGLVPFFIHKIYQLDYNRNTGKYRMLECFFPQETQDRPAPKAKPNQGDSQDRIKADAACIGAWPHEVGVQRVVWNAGNGLAAAGLLASATASGLCRIDELWGRWIKDKVPYTGIEHIRWEAEDGMDVDDSDASSGP